MTSRTLSYEQLKALDFQREILYESFQRAIETKIHQDAVWGRGLFTIYGSSLLTATRHSSFMEWNRDTKRAAVFDRYILPFAIGNYSSVKLEQLTQLEGCRDETQENRIKSDELRQAIGDNKVNYQKIRDMAGLITDTRDFSTVMSALNYVRERYG